MSLRHRIMPSLTSLLTSEKTRHWHRQAHEWRRRIGKHPHRITVWLRVADPYSYLLSQILPRLSRHFDIVIEPVFFETLAEEMYPAPDMLQDYALLDAQRLGHYHQLHTPPLANLPDTQLIQRAHQLLLAIAPREDGEHLTLIRQILHCVWQAEPAKLAHLEELHPPVAADLAEQALEANSRRLLDSGHYLGAMLQYGGEWYWGLDRLPHLTQRLESLGLSRVEHDFSINEVEHSYPSDFWITDHESLAEIRQQRIPLQFYFSFRSPYSYLALERTFALTDHYGLALDIRPVLPMVMRGLPVPRSKRQYIVLDAKREAERHGVPFGRICDPVGSGVERCMALFDYAREADREREYLLSVTRGIWAEGLDVSREEGLRPLIERAGLSWEEARVRLNRRDWQQWAALHRDEMAALGLWGVPCLYMQQGSRTLAIWGQDRFWAIENALADSLSHPAPLP